MKTRYTPTKRPGRTVQFSLRIPEELHDHLVSLLQFNQRSLCGQIAYMLRDYIINNLDELSDAAGTNAILKHTEAAGKPSKQAKARPHSSWHHVKIADPPLRAAI
jgi:hypothetical protein